MYEDKDLMVQMRKNEDEDARQEEEEDKDKDEKERESERNNEFQRAIYLEGTTRIEGQSLKGEDEDARAMWMLVCTEGNNLPGYKNK